MAVRVFLAGAVMALAAAASAGAANLVTNGSFETGDFTGWDGFGAPAGSSVVGAIAGQPSPTDGQHQGRFGPVQDTAYIIQSLDTLVGGTYRLSFDLAAPCSPLGCGGGITTAYALFNGESVLALASEGFAYTHYSFDRVATSTVTHLNFQFRNQPWFYYLDNVSVTEVVGDPGGIPEPSAWALMILGSGAVGAVARRRRRLAAA